MSSSDKKASLIKRSRDKQEKRVRLQPLLPLPIESVGGHSTLTTRQVNNKISSDQEAIRKALQICTKSLEVVAELESEIRRLKKNFPQ